MLVGSALVACVAVDSGDSKLERREHSDEAQTLHGFECQAEVSIDRWVDGTVDDVGRTASDSEHRLRWSELDRGSDGTIDETVEIDYDGDLLTREWHTYGPGSSEGIDIVDGFERTYDADGNVLTHTATYGDFVTRTTYTYVDGRVDTVDIDQDIDGLGPNDTRLTMVYDGGGLLVEQLYWGFDEGGVPVAGENHKWFTYEDDGRTRYGFTGLVTEPGTYTGWDIVRTDDEGRRVGYTADLYGDDAYEVDQAWDYDDDGRLVGFHDDEPGVWIVDDVHQYDEDGNLVHTDHDVAMDAATYTGSTYYAEWFEAEPASIDYLPSGDCD